MPRFQSVATLIFSLVVLAVSVVVAIRTPGRHELYGDGGRSEAVGPEKVVSGR